MLIARGSAISFILVSFVLPGFILAFKRDKLDDDTMIKISFKDIKNSFKKRKTKEDKYADDLADLVDEFLK